MSGYVALSLTTILSPNLLISLFTYAIFISIFNINILLRNGLQTLVLFFKP